MPVIRFVVNFGEQGRLLPLGETLPLMDREQGADGPALMQTCDS